MIGDAEIRLLRRRKESSGESEFFGKSAFRWFSRSGALAEDNTKAATHCGAAPAMDHQPAENADSSKRNEPVRSKLQDADALLERAAELLTRQAIDRALAGDMVALRLCVERFFPPRKERPITFALPNIEGLQDLPKATHALLRALSSGELTPLEAAAVAKIVGTHISAIEAAEIDERLTALENIMMAPREEHIG